MNPNEPESRGGVPALLRAVGALAVLVAALIGILAALEVIPAEALREWFTKTALVALIVAAAIVALWALMRSGAGKP